MGDTQDLLKPPVSGLRKDRGGFVLVHLKTIHQHGAGESFRFVTANNEVAAGRSLQVLGRQRRRTAGKDHTARAHLGSRKFRYKLRMSVLVSPSMQRMLGNNFLKINCSHDPTRFCSQDEVTIEWLRGIGDKT
jgi:hypothetical protein